MDGWMDGRKEGRKEKIYFKCKVLHSKTVLIQRIENERLNLCLRRKEKGQRLLKWYTFDRLSKLHTVTLLINHINLRQYIKFSCEPFQNYRHWLDPIMYEKDSLELTHWKWNYYWHSSSVQHYHHLEVTLAPNVWCFLEGTFLHSNNVRGIEQKRG